MYSQFLIALLTLSIWVGSPLAQELLVTVNNEEGRPQYGAHVALVPLNGNKGAYGITNNQGSVRLSWNGPSVLMVSHVGYLVQKDTIQVFSANKVIQLGVNPFSLSDFVLTGQATPVRLDESLHKVRVIDRQRIEAQGAQNLRDLLQQDLNIRVTQDAVLGAGMTMQGVGGENIKIMVDGVPVIGRLDGNIDLSQLNLQNIEKVEIVEGPMSVQFGTNALGGVINLITKKDQNHKLEGSLNTFYESIGNYNFDANVGFKVGKTRVQTGAGRYFFSGANPGDTSNSRFQTWKPREQYFGNILLGRRIKGMDLRYQGDLYREYLLVRGRPEAPFFIMASDQHFQTWRHNHAVFLQGAIAPSHHIDITASYSYYLRERESYRKDLSTLEEVLFDTNFDRFQLWLSRGVYSYIPEGSPWQIQAGYEVNVETAEGPRILTGFQAMTDLAGFATATYQPLKALQMKAGVRYGYNSSFTPIPVPSFHLRYAPVKGLDLRGSYARGFRAPGLKELYFEFVDVNHRIFGNPDLRSESSHNLQAEGNYRLGLSKTQRTALTFSLGGFYNYIDDQIRLVITSITPDSLIYRNENITYFRTMGLRWMNGFSWKNMDINLGFTYTGIENGLNQMATGGNRMVYYPEGQANLVYKFPQWRGQANLFFKQTGRQPILYSRFDSELDAEVLEEGFVDGFSNMDISYTQHLFKNRLSIVAMVRNVFNITNVAQTAVTGGAHSSGSATLPTLWGRTFGFSLRYNFIVAK